MTTTTTTTTSTLYIFDDPIHYPEQNHACRDLILYPKNINVPTELKWIPIHGQEPNGETFPYSQTRHYLVRNGDISKLTFILPFLWFSTQNNMSHKCAPQLFSFKNTFTQLNSTNWSTLNTKNVILILCSTEEYGKYFCDAKRCILGTEALQNTNDIDHIPVIEMIKRHLGLVNVSIQQQQYSIPTITADCFTIVMSQLLTVKVAPEKTFYPESNLLL